MPTSEMECRTADGQITFRGLASSTDSPYEMGFYTETITRGAFGETLSKNPAVQLLVNHEGLPIAATRNGSLILTETDRGLEFEGRADESDPDAARVASKVSSGLMSECSFAFRVMKQTWDEDYTQRDISEVSLDRGDVSIVNFGANPNTNVTLRSLLADSEFSDEEIAEMRDDPAIITVVRRLNIPIVPISAEVSVGEVTSIAGSNNLDFYRARAFALGLRK